MVAIDNIIKTLSPLQSQDTLGTFQVEGIVGEPHCPAGPSHLPHSANRESCNELSSHGKGGNCQGSDRTIVNLWQIKPKFKGRVQMGIPNHLPFF